MTFKKHPIFFIVFIIFLITLFTSGIFFRSSLRNQITSLLEKPNFNFLKPPMSTTSIPPIHHVFVIVEENHDWQTILNNSDAPYINSTLLQQGAYTSNYHNIPESLGGLHPSELNYIFMQAGTISFPGYTFTTDDIPSAQNSTSSHDHLVSLLKKNGYTWKSYQEGIPGTNCPIDDINTYAPKHNPFIYFHDVSGNPPNSTNQYCQTHIRPLKELVSDLTTGKVANYNFITPNLQHDMHDGTIAQADTWLSQTVPIITNSTTFKNNGVLFITWDEGSESNGKNNSIGMIIESPFIKKGYTNTIPYSHASLLKTVEEVFNLKPLLGLAKDPSTQDLFGLFDSNK